MSDTVHVQVLVPNWGYWNGRYTEILTKGTVRTNVDRGVAERAAARNEVAILAPHVAPEETPAPAPLGTVEPSEPVEDSTEEPVVNFESMSMADLRAYAAEHGIDVRGLRKKADVLEAVRNA